MKYGIAIFPSKKLQDEANSYRMRYDPKYALIPPHITMKESFEVSNNNLEELINDLQKVSNSISPFSIHVYKVKSFHPIKNVIYFAVKPTDELMSLHKQLNSGKYASNKPYTFVPHITIGQNLSDQEHSDILGRMNMMDINHKETVDRFQLMYELENGSWTVYETFHLGKDC